MTAPAAQAGTPDTIVLVHGLWMTPRSWEQWSDRYSRRGYRVLAPAWPGMEGDVEELRHDPSPMTRLDLPKVIDHYDGIIRGLDTPPIIMGHSLGGAIVLLLIDRGLASSAVSVASGTVKGVPPFSTIRASLPLFNPFNRGKATGLTAKQFHYAFCNTLSREESDAVYERQHVAAANRVAFQIALTAFTRNPATTVDYRNDDRAPLLFIAFEHDHLVPPKLSRRTAERYEGSGAITALKEFSGRPHFPGVPGWEEVADHALEWASNPPGLSRSR